MTSGLDNLSLALFTALAPAGVVAFIIMALARLFAIDHERAVRIDRMIALPFAVALVGFIASATHLGTPANALHVFSGVGTSPLSNEVLAAVMFLFLAGSYWMVAFKVNFPDAAAKPWLLVACLAGIALLACTSQAYAVRTVPTWNTPYSPANLLLTGLFEGTVLSQLFLAAAKVPLSRWSFLLVGLGAASLAAGVISMLAQNAYLASIANNEISAASLGAGLPSCHRHLRPRRGWRAPPRQLGPATPSNRVCAPHPAYRRRHPRLRRRLCNTHCVLQSAYDRRILARRNH